MAGIGTVIAGALGGGALFGGVLALVDPLKVRQPTGGANDAQVRDWSDDAIPSADGALSILEMLGYTGPNAIAGFQRDASEVLGWHAALAMGQERLPPPEAGYSQTPSALTRIAAGAPLSATNTLDQRTVEVLAEVFAAVVFASGKECMTAEGAVVEADAADCRQAWEAAFRYAYEANLAAGAPPPGGVGSGPSFQQRPADEYDEWQEPAANAMQETGQYGEFRWRTYKDNVGRANHQFYYKTWRVGEGLGAAQGPFGSAQQAKDAAFAFMAEQLGQGASSGPVLTGRTVPPPNGGGVGGGLGG